ncbi:MAG: YbaB/EbfC family nucleoid-associated protein [Anaerolineae bacterium]|nr:YbaB/EbfC family nucleoid-associated protein [Anaerolineae bacterium]
MSKGMELPQGMAEQLKQLQDQLLSAQAELANEIVTATSGGGAVSIAVTGDQRCTEVSIDAQLLADGDVEMLQDLVKAAINTALEESRQLASSRLGPLSGGISI